MNDLLFVHPTIDDRIINRIWHGDEVYGQVYIAAVFTSNHLWTLVKKNEIDVVWQPASSEQDHHNYKHFHDLEISSKTN